MKDEFKVETRNSERCAAFSRARVRAINRPNQLQNVWQMLIFARFAVIIPENALFLFYPISIVFLQFP